MLTNDDLEKMGFKALPHFTIGDSRIFDLGRDRILSVMCVGTPNEMVFISQIDHDTHEKITDAVALHNYDYDGYLTKEHLLFLLCALTHTKVAQQQSIH